MDYVMRVKPNGEVKTEVEDRGTHLCADILRVTNALGPQKSDEEIGPDCEPVIETSNE